MKRLIAHADDLGLTKAGNDGILKAHLQGIVTSASLLANGPALEDALRRLPPSLDLGLHLDLSEGRPLIRGHRTLVRADGRFHGKAEARRLALRNHFAPGEVERETLAQIDRLLDSGLNLTHLDGHQHLHVYGALAVPVARAARKRRLRWVRLPADVHPHPALRKERRRQILDYARLASAARPVYQAAGLRSVDAFAGSSLSGAWTLGRMAAFLASVRPGITELMLHPGTHENERRVLTHERLPLLLNEQVIRLAHFGNL